ncbi:hypothetical protein JZ751_004817, partial [Albula glossodonta]
MGELRPEHSSRRATAPHRNQQARITAAAAAMSRSPERISSYRRHFEDSGATTYQVRVSSPSPPRVRHRSASYSRSAMTTTLRAEALGRRTISGSRRSHVTSASMGALCLGVGMGATLDLDAAAAENQAFLNTRTTERQEMVVLNDRLAAYIEKASLIFQTCHASSPFCPPYPPSKTHFTFHGPILLSVRTLEQQNKLLEAEIEALQNRFVKPSGLRMLYEEQLRELKRIADQMKAQRNIAVAAKEAMAAQLEMLKAKYEEAVAARKKVELEIEAFRPDVDAATSARIALEKQLENLEAELLFLQRVHKQEIDELMKQIYSAVAKAEVSFSLPDLASALKHIQSQYDEIAAKNLQIQNKERELEALRTRNETLEAMILEAQEKYKKIEEDLQAKIDALTLELKTTKEKIALHLREYQDLLNIKMALEIEITTYRKLIEGEDLRLSTMVRSLSLVSSSATAAVSGSVSLGAASLAGGLAAASLGAGGLGAAASLGAGGLGAAASLDSCLFKLYLKLKSGTVKTEDDTMHSDTQERTIIITGAADEAEEEGEVEAEAEVEAQVEAQVEVEAETEDLKVYANVKLLSSMVEVLHSCLHTAYRYLRSKVKDTGFLAHVDGLSLDDFLQSHDESLLLSIGQQSSILLPRLGHHLSHRIHQLHPIIL